jgi:hypothetical protein
MISSASKKKLKAFQFIEGAPEGPLTETKENLPPPDEAVESLLQARPPKQPPSTPLNTTPRLPLTHLIGQQPPRSAENQAQHDEPKLQWKQSTPGSQNTPARKRKRARSSSPPTGGNKQFKTPKPDPASDVWSRYNANLNDSAVKASQSGLERLLIESSPRSSETAGSVGGLRRYNSCGYQWPASKKKRKKQKTGRIPTNQDHGIEENANDAPVISKVSLLLEEVQRKSELERRHVIDEESESRQDGPSSSSPVALPTIVVEEAADPLESPLQNRGDSKSFLPNADAPQKTLKGHDPSFCEYDDDFDIDGDELDQLIASTSAVPQVQSEVNQPSSPAKAAQSSSTDEYGDDALSGQEWDRIEAPLTAAQPPTTINIALEGTHVFESKSSKTAQEASKDHSQDSDFEEYGDFDVEDFENFDMSKVTDNPDINSVRLSLAIK